MKRELDSPQPRRPPKLLQLIWMPRPMTYSTTSAPEARLLTNAWPHPYRLRREAMVDSKTTSSSSKRKRLLPMDLDQPITTWDVSPVTRLLIQALSASRWNFGPGIFPAAVSSITLVAN